MEKRILLILMVFLFPLASALDTSITIQSQPNADVMINFLDLNTGRVITGSIFNEKADGNGKVFIDYSSEDKLLRFSIGVQIGGVFKSFEGFNGSKSNYAKFNMVEAGKEILINVNTDIPTLDYIGVEEEPEEIVAEESTEEEEESIIEDIAVKEETEVENNPITGFAIDGESLVPSSKKIIYSVILIILIIAIILVFLFLKKRKSKNITSAVKLREKMDSVQEEEELEDAERRIREAEKEIKAIRNKKSELEEAEKKFEEDKKRLEELKGNIGR